MTAVSVLPTGQLSLPELAAVANREHRLAIASGLEMVNHAISVGEALIEAKTQVAHGGWLPWLGENFEASASTATRYMQVAANRARVHDLEEPSLRKALVAVSDAKDGMTVHYSSDSPEWETPQPLFDLLDAEFGFQLDVCATSQLAKCARHFTPEQDGLAQDWRGICWMNPPYGNAIPNWIRKAHESAHAGAIVVCLIPARVDTAWWWDHCRHAEIRFLRGRLKFSNGDMGAPFPSAIVIFGRPAKTVWWEAWPTA